jgi:hypothetical protein
MEVSLVFFSECSTSLKYQEKQQKEIAKCWNPKKEIFFIKREKKLRVF